MSQPYQLPSAQSLAQAIQQLWPQLASPTALAKLPADSLITGRVPPSQQMPYARLEIAAGSEGDLSNANQYRQQSVVFHVWSDTFDDGDAIAPLLRAAFANAAFDWAAGGCLRMKPDGPAQSRQTDDPEIKAWHTTQRFRCSISEPRAD